MILKRFESTISNDSTEGLFRKEFGSMRAKLRQRTK